MKLEDTPFSAQLVMSEQSADYESDLETLASEVGIEEGDLVATYKLVKVERVVKTGVIITKQEYPNAKKSNNKRS